ncbi:hypothetical protein R9C00_04740 [Flammeovirgaceae bacterium SG7u.111]|nr:hypothetical protein [Flammeovirgaceae bacterium SG7u.132]WPO36750.1 hypothetical protein R9C00_04740 [Flammeovirgaceae bacterium SG7u.111]
MKIKLLLILAFVFTVSLVNAQQNWGLKGSGLIPYVNDADGVMEVGQYIDFHDTKTNPPDYSVRLKATGNILSLYGALKTSSYLKVGGNFELSHDGNRDLLFDFPGTTGHRILAGGSNGGSLQLQFSPVINSNSIFAIDEQLSSDSYNIARRFIITKGGNVGIGTTSPNNKLQIVDGGNVSYAGGEIGFAANNGAESMALIKATLNFSNINKDAGDLRFYTREFLKSPNRPADELVERMIIRNDGNVGIGTTSPEAMLTVAGEAHARKVKVTINAGADFVFAEDYDLPNLNKVAEFVKNNKHLPEIPSEKEMRDNGLDLGEMDIKLLQKVEELTLYLIQQQKDMEALKKENQSLKQRLEKLENK